MSDHAKKLLLKTFSKSLIEGNAALFVGAGISRPSGYVDWKELLRDVAKELDLDVDKEADLVALAQFHVNKHRNRSQLNQLLIDEFTKDAKLTENHRHIAALPIHTVWTTNYDDLLEQAFRNANKNVDCKLTKENLAITVPHRAVTIYKMHGDRTRPDEAVLTKGDYESYDENRRIFSTKLKGDLIEKTFLFLGFSFTDPNIDYILSRIRLLLGENQRQHFCIMKNLSPPASRSKKAQENYKYQQTRLRHRIEDLKRYCITPVMIDEYSEVTELLRELGLRSHFRDVFVSGSAIDFSPLGQDRVESLCRELGRRLIQEGFDLVSGYGLGIGGNVIIGAVEALNRNDEERMTLRPFPQQASPGVSPADFAKQYREDMVGLAGTCIFLCGNKAGSTAGTTVVADGVLDEYEIAARLNRNVIPVGATGHAARQLWQRMNASPPRWLSSVTSKRHFQILGDSSKSNDDLLDALFAILKHLMA